jgi:2-phosphoglycerate kinase
MCVVAIGGCASVGKTTLAAALADRLEVSEVVHVDDLRKIREASAGPSFLDTTPAVWDSNHEWLCGSLIASTRKLHGAIATTIDRLLASDGGIVEGEGVEPSGMAHHAAAKAVYVIEEDGDRLAATFVARPSRGRFLALSEPRRSAVVEMNRLYSTWLREEADRYGQAWVSAHPWATLADRALAAMAQP